MLGIVAEFCYSLERSNGTFQLLASYLREVKSSAEFHKAAQAFATQEAHHPRRRPSGWSLQVIGVARDPR